MAKLSLSDFASLANQVSFLNALNSNFALVEAALENTLSRDGTSPNQMEADLDMNSNQILNLPAAVQATEPVRLQEFEALEDEFETLETNVNNSIAALQASVDEVDDLIIIINQTVADAEALLADVEALMVDVKISCFIALTPLDGELVVRYVIAENGLLFPLNLSGSRAHAVAASTGVVAFSIRKNNVEFAQCVFSATSTGAFTGAETTFNTGDVLSIVAPDPKDATLSDISITLSCTRGN